jgi:hypothetical protein
MLGGYQESDEIRQHLREVNTDPVQKLKFIPRTIVGRGKNGFGGLTSATLQDVPPSFAFNFMHTLEQY